MDRKKMCQENPNVEFFKQIIQEDLSLLKMLATNGKYIPDEQ